MKTFLKPLPAIGVAAGAFILTLASQHLLGSSLGSDDSSFVTNAAKGNLAEVELGRLAARKALSPEVREFGNRMIRDHTKTYHEIAALARSKGLDVPKSPSLGEDVSVTHLKLLSGKSFDDAYIKMMVKDHQDDVADFEKSAKYSQDSDVKHFAEKTLPTLQSHLEKIEKIQSDFGGSTK